MDDREGLLILVGFLAGAILVYMLLRKRKEITTLTRDEQGRITEIIEVCS